MHTTTEQNQQLLEAIEELQQTADLFLVKEDLVEMFSNSLLSPQLVNNPKKSHEMFFTFKQLYNFLITVKDIKSPEARDLNLL